MFFLLSKTFDVLVAPLTWALLAAAYAALPGAARRRRVSAALAVSVLLVAANETVADLTWHALERAAPNTYRPDPAYDAVVVLGGIADNEAFDAPYAEAYNDNVERIIAAYEVLRRGEARFGLLSSGPVFPAGRARSEAAMMAAQLVTWGVDPARLVEEGASRNTRENAVESASIARSKGWQRLVVVTSAYHMPRALGCFHAVGLYPDALPVDYRTTLATPLRPHLLPRAEALARTTAALRELVGRGVYRLRGYARDF